jgi:hypothetical protein
MITSKSNTKEIWLLEQSQQQHQKQQPRVEKYAVHHACNIASKVVLSSCHFVFMVDVFQESG